MAGFRVPHADHCVCAPCCNRRRVFLLLAIKEENAGRGDVFTLGRKPALAPAPWPKCSVDGCHHVRTRRGLCDRHYKRQLRHGDVNANSNKRRTE